MKQNHIQALIHEHMEKTKIDGPTRQDNILEGGEFPNTQVKEEENTNDESFDGDNHFGELPGDMNEEFTDLNNDFQEDNDNSVNNQEEEEMEEFPLSSEIYRCPISCQITFPTNELLKKHIGY